MASAPQWRKHVDPTGGQPYYENVATGAVSWDAPAGLLVEPIDR